MAYKIFTNEKLGQALERPKFFHFESMIQNPPWVCLSNGLVISLSRSQ